MGPPRVPPNCCCLNGDFSAFCLSSKNVFEFRLSLRANTKALPRKSLVPLFVMTLTTPPTERPYSAL